MNVTKIGPVSVCKCPCRGTTARQGRPVDGAGVDEPLFYLRKPPSPLETWFSYRRIMPEGEDLLRCRVRVLRYSYQAVVKTDALREAQWTGVFSRFPVRADILRSRDGLCLVRLLSVLSAFPQHRQCVKIVASSCKRTRYHWSRNPFLTAKSSQNLTQVITDGTVHFLALTRYRSFHKMLVCVES